MIVSAQMRHCRNCGSVNLEWVKDKEPKSKKLNVKVVAKCKDCKYVSDYPCISDFTMKQMINLEGEEGERKGNKSSED